MSKELPIVTFYSYKGGTGRSVTALNTVSSLAKSIGATEEKPVILVDADVDSGGLTTLITGTANVWENWNSQRLVEAEFKWNVVEDCRTLDESLRDISELVGAEPGSVKFLGSDLRGADHTPVVADAPVKFLRFYQTNLHSFPRRYSAIVFDSSSGAQGAATFCHAVSDVLVCCCRITRQHRMGTFNYLDSLKGRERAIEPDYIIVPVAVPQSAGNPEFDALREKHLNDIEKQGGPFGAQVLAEGIPEVQRFKFEEKVLKEINSDNFADEREAFGRYKELGSLVSKTIKKRSKQ